MSIKTDQLERHIVAIREELEKLKQKSTEEQPKIQAPQKQATYDNSFILSTI